MWRPIPTKILIKGKSCHKIGIGMSNNLCLIRAVAQSWRRGGNASNNCTAMAQLGTAAEFFGSMSSHEEDVGRKFCEQDMDQCNIKV